MSITLLNSVLSRAIVPLLSESICLSILPSAEMDQVEVIRCIPTNRPFGLLLCYQQLCLFVV